MTAAAQLCHQASFTSRLRFEKQNKHLGMKILSHNMAKAVMQFWQSAELHLDNDGPEHNCIGGSVESGKVDSSEASVDKRRNSDMVLVIYYDSYSVHEKNDPAPLATTLANVVIKLHCYMNILNIQFV